MCLIKDNEFINWQDNILHQTNKLNYKISKDSLYIDLGNSPIILEGKNNGIYGEWKGTTCYINNEILECGGEVYGDILKITSRKICQKKYKVYKENPFNYKIVALLYDFLNSKEFKSAYATSDKFYEDSNAVKDALEKNNIEIIEHTNTKQVFAINNKIYTLENLVFDNDDFFERHYSYKLTFENISCTYWYDFYSLIIKHKDFCINENKSYLHDFGYLNEADSTVRIVEYYERTNKKEFETCLNQINPDPNFDKREYWDYQQ